MARRLALISLALVTAMGSSVFSTSALIASASESELCFGQVPTIVGSLSVGQLGRAGGHPSEHHPGWCLCVERIALAALPAEPPIWARHLENDDALAVQISGQPSSVGAGRLCCVVRSQATLRRNLGRVLVR